MLRGSFLVRRSQLPAFDAQVDDAARRERGRLRFKYTGPLAPHSFVAVEGGV